MIASRFCAVLVLVIIAFLPVAAQQKNGGCPMPTRAGLPAAPKLARAARIAVTDTVVLSVEKGHIRNVSFVEDDKGQPMNAVAIRQALESWLFDEQFSGNCEVKFVWRVLPEKSKTAAGVTFTKGQVEITSTSLR